MPFLPKDVLEAEAKRRGIDLAGLSWPEQQKVVQEAMRVSDSFSDAPKPKPYTPQKKNQTTGNAKQRYINAMVESLKKAKPVQICGEVKPTRYTPSYEEDLGEGIEVEDVSYLRSGMPDLTNSDASQTYVVKGKTGRKVYAKSGLPHQNARIYYDPKTHWYAPIIVDFNGKEGYIWKHHKYKGVKTLLLESGYYEEYRHLFESIKYPNNIWMAGGKIWAVSIPLVERIFREIEKKAKQDAGR